MIATAWAARARLRRFSAGFVAMSLTTFAIDGPIVYIKGEPKTADAAGLTNSLQRPSARLGPAAQSHSGLTSAMTA